MAQTSKLTERRTPGGEVRARAARLVLPGIMLVMLAGMIVLHAWVSEDAYITFRTVDNFLSGHGLTWNPPERVQSYTHPLWMFVIAFASLFSGQVFYVSLVVCLLASFAAAGVLAFGIARAPIQGAVALLILGASQAFVDYSTSGLENPLTHLLLMLFALAYLREGMTRRRLFALSLLAALAVVNRQDTVLLYLPALAVAFWPVRSLKAAGLVALGFGPLVLWETFSILYYGFPFPNTAYAKLSTGIPAGELVRHGLAYLTDSLRRDPVTLAAILTACLLAGARRHARSIALAAGTVLYIAYIVCVGGDFMAGRFLSAPLVVGVIVLSRLEWVQAKWTKPVTAVAAAGVAVLALMGTHSLLPPDAQVRDVGRLIGPTGIADEKAFYFGSAGLIHADGRVMPAHAWADEGRRVRRLGEKVVLNRNVGFFGYFTGPEVYVVDTLALSDPLLARLPAVEKGTWRIGHYDRLIPDGYLATLRSGRNQLADAGLAQYYDHLSRAIRGPLWAPGRLAEIWRLNRGQYDYLLDAHRARPMERKTLAQVQAAPPTPLTQAGLRVDLGELRREPALGIELSGCDDDLMRAHAGNPAPRNWLIMFCRGGRSLGGVWIPPIPGPGLTRLQAPAPPMAVASGYDSVEIIPVCGAGTYAVGKIIPLGQQGR